LEIVKEVHLQISIVGEKLIPVRCSAEHNQKLHCMG
jgi:hypothetical protein